MSSRLRDIDRWRRARTDLPTRLGEAAALVKLLFGRGAADATAVYDLLSAHNNLGKETLYLNMGYWRAAHSYDEACQALALLLAERAQLGAGQAIVDAGFGFGDQDILWARRFDVRITGFNVTAAQVEVARQRVRNAGVADRVELRCQSALATSLDDASVDRVLALESAFHFPSRDAFFAEARRVLRPGGRIALADICAAATPSPRLIDRVNGWVARRSWQIPAANDYGADEYAARLAAAGFVDVAVERISDDVFLPFGAYARVRQADPDVVARANPLLRAVWRAPATDRVFDYVLVSGRRPTGEGAPP
jgi:cyclopropane fatty-acyl-phospholipid synthase-like methyltransferase